MLRLHQAWEFHVPAQGPGVLLSDLGTGRLLRLNGDRDRWLDLCRLLRDGAPASAINKELARWPDDGAAVRQVLAYLVREGVLLERPRPQTVAADAPYDRQIRFFDIFESNQVCGADLNERLQASRVVLVGLGGYGVWLATMLLRMGVRRVVGIDADRVELSNLHRQFLYMPTDVGRLKAEVCQARLTAPTADARFVPVVEHLTDVDQVAQLVAGASLVINAFGYSAPEDRHSHSQTFHAIARGCELANTPSLTFGGSWHGPLRVPGTGDACAGCLTRVEPFRSRLSQPRPVLRDPAPAMSARLGINASICVWEAVRYLSGVGSRLRSAALTIDTMTYQSIRLASLTPSRECVVCHDYRT